MTSQYLEFGTLQSSGKTKVIAVYSKRSGETLARIKWYGPWRQYTLWPEPDTIWNTTCLLDVNLYMQGLMDERRASRSA